MVEQSICLRSEEFAKFRYRLVFNYGRDIKLLAYQFVQEVCGKDASHIPDAQFIACSFNILFLGDQNTRWKFIKLARPMD